MHTSIASAFLLVILSWVKLEAVLVEAEGVHRDHAAGRRLLGALEDIADPQHELLGAEGLGEVVVCPHVEALDSLVELALGREHEDRDPAGA